MANFESQTRKKTKRTVYTSRIAPIQIPRLTNGKKDVNSLATLSEFT